MPDSVRCEEIGGRMAAGGECAVNLLDQSFIDLACSELRGGAIDAPLVGMWKCVPLNAREVVSRVEPGKFVLDELMNLGLDPFGIIERSDANGKIATVSHERMIRRRIFAIQPRAARSAEEA